MISRMTSAWTTRHWMRSASRSEVGVPVAEAVSSIGSVPMFADAAEQQAQRAPQEKPADQHREDATNAPWLHGLVRHDGLRDSLEVELLSQGLAARLLQRGQRARELLARKIAFECQ